jgi:hypothetical protein
MYILLLDTGWMVRGLKIDVGEIFRTPTDRHRGPPCLCAMSTGSVKRLGRGVDPPPPSSAEVKERVKLYLYTPLYLQGLLWGEF